MPPQIQNQLAQLSDHEILSRTEFHVRNERRQTHILLWHFSEIDSRRLYFQVGCNSLFEYLSEYCRYGHTAAYEKQNATRLLRKIPEVTEKLEAGEINPTQMAAIESNLRENKRRGLIKNLGEEKQKARDVIEKVKNRTLEQSAVVMAQEFDRPVKKKPRRSPQKDGSVRLQFTLTKEQNQLFTQAQNLISHSVPSRDLAETVAYLAKFLLKKRLGKEIFETEESAAQAKADNKTAMKNTASKIKAEKPTPTSDSEVRKPAKKRQPISVHSKRELLEEASYQCEYVDPLTHKRCECQHQLQIDHITPWAFTENNEKENLRILCGPHNRLEARRWGFDYQLVMPL